MSDLSFTLIHYFNSLKKAPSPLYSQDLGKFFSCSHLGASIPKPSWGLHYLGPYPPPTSKGQAQSLKRRKLVFNFFSTLPLGTKGKLDVNRHFLFKLSNASNMLVDGSLTLLRSDLVGNSLLFRRRLFDGINESYLLTR